MEPTEVAATEPCANSEAGAVGAPDPQCLCGHPESQHRARMLHGHFIDRCLVCECVLFSAVDEPLDLTPTSLILAWDTRWCPSCSSRWMSETAVCCGKPCVPVRMEMHSRDSPAAGGG
jgi:hypothetical protein